jgi:hypothetical protein
MLRVGCPQFGYRQRQEALVFTTGAISSTAIHPTSYKLGRGMFNGGGGMAVE